MSWIARWWHRTLGDRRHECIAVQSEKRTRRKLADAQSEMDLALERLTKVLNEAPNRTIRMKK